MDIRIDDVLTVSSDPKVKGKELQKLQKHVNWAYEVGLPVSVAVLCQDIEAFPDAIAYLKEERNSGRMAVQLHGWDHENYAVRSAQVISNHLSNSLRWFREHMDGLPTKWITPHGADSVVMREVAAHYGLTVETTASPVIDQKVADRLVRKAKDISPLTDKTVMVHTWERGLRLYRICQVYKHGTVEAAMKASTLDPKSYKICWENWIAA